MKNAVLIAEFNPLHNGHARLIEQIRKELQPNALIVIMSGDFVQRGEPAVFDKYLRANMALAAGADLVLSLPAIYTVAPAEIYARGAVMAAAAAGIGDCLVFGSESGDLSLLKEAVTVSETEPFRKKLTAALTNGDSYPKAFSSAMQETPGSRPEVASLVDAPNNVLGIEYIRSINSLSAPLAPFTIKRFPADEHISSATELRNCLRNGRDIDAFLPSHVSAILSGSAPDSGSHAPCAKPLPPACPVFADTLSGMMKGSLLRASREELYGLCDIHPDLANRIYEKRLQFERFDDFADLIKVKAFTHARIRRCLIQLLIGMTRKERDAMLAERTMILRVLGFREASRSLLGTLHDAAASPVIIRGADHDAILDPASPYSELVRRMLDIDLLAERIYDGMAYPPSLRRPAQSKMPVIV